MSPALLRARKNRRSFTLERASLSIPRDERHLRSAKMAAGFAETVARACRNGCGVACGWWQSGGGSEALAVWLHG
jgi:hypothetical protein